MKGYTLSVAQRCSAIWLSDLLPNREVVAVQAQLIAKFGPPRVGSLFSFHVNG
jgi:hypothetical protein